MLVKGAHADDFYGRETLIYPEVYIYTVTQLGFQTCIWFTFDEPLVSLKNAYLWQNISYEIVSDKTSLPSDNTQRPHIYR